VHSHQRRLKHVTTKQLKIDRLRLPDIEWMALSECVERRNLIIHNDGTVNSLYLSKTNKYWSDPRKEAPTNGTKLEVAGWYIDDAMDLVFVAGLGLIDCVSKKLKEAERAIESVLDSSL
jgi:hypothetical protein